LRRFLEFWKNLMKCAPPFWLENIRMKLRQKCSIRLDRPKLHLENLDPKNVEDIFIG